MFSKACSALLFTGLAASASRAASLQLRDIIYCRERRHTAGKSHGRGFMAFDWRGTDTCYGVRQALHGFFVSFDLQIGQVLCVSGGTGGGGSTHLNGRATYYDPDGGWGANPRFIFRTAIWLSHSERETGTVAPIADTRLLFSVHQTRTIVVTVQDLCPGCQGANGIDLTEGAMAALDSNYINDGVINVVWWFN
ncbi:hypothetical protein C8J57DRAFT_1504236 [Mycena rebaudengoi]|nr:hypothetical protein C8J57DRAFT_1504236 [Mycena rebaudengoi]